ncbi:MAG: hypothetical protein ACI9WU_000841 [Myxococcota bacterium]|jgi:hypothetical protein
MTLLATTSQLHAAWSQIMTALRSDPFLGSRFAESPEGALAELGFSLAPSVLETLQSALPG